MEPQANELNQFLMLGLHIAAVIGTLYFLRRFNVRNRIDSQQRVQRLLQYREDAHRNIRRIEDEQWHVRLSSTFRISRYQLAISDEQRARLADVDQYQESRTGRT